MGLISIFFREEKWQKRVVGGRGEGIREDVVR